VVAPQGREEERGLIKEKRESHRGEKEKKKKKEPGKPEYDQREKGRGFKKGCSRRGREKRPAAIISWQEKRGERNTAATLPSGEKKKKLGPKDLQHYVREATPGAVPKKK